MENKHLGVTLGLFLLISGFCPIVGIIFVNETSSTSLISLVNATEIKMDNKLSSKTLSTSPSNELKKEFNVTEVSELTEFVLPNECSSSYKTEVVQPKLTNLSAIKKCCPLGENFHYTESGIHFCANETLKFEFNAIHAKFYENCIEDQELNIFIDVKVENYCKNGLIFNENAGDILYVIQNGSLLRVDADFQSYEIYEHYCLDMDSNEKVLTAIVCDFDDMLFKVNRTQALLFACCMLISVPFLIITAVLYLLIPELNDLHGKSLAAHSICLASGFFLLAFTQFRDMYSIEGYFIQFCIIACFFWLTVMWMDICMHAWYFLPKGIKQTEQTRQFIFYCLISFGIPLILVILTFKNNLNGLPSYYIKGTTQVARTSQKFFIPPISLTLIINLCLYVASIFGFKKLQKMKITAFLAFQLKKSAKENNLSAYNVQHMEKVETIAKSTSYLTIIMTINWLFEIISFYNDTSSTVFDVINALQGVIIFGMFVCLPHPMKLVRRWWKDRGSLQITKIYTDKKSSEIEMDPLKGPRN